MLHAIATGATRHNEISDAIRADPTRLLDRLVGLRLIERVQPVTETGRTRRRIYRIADNFLAFYLNILTRYRTEIEAGLGPTVLPVLLDSLDDHQGERLAGEAKWAREVSAPRLVADLYRKAAALPGAPHELRIAICAREQVLNLPEDVLAITAEDIFGP